MQAQQLQDQTTIISDASAKVVQNITDRVAIATARATKQADIIGDQAQITADTLGERGLYGLNLVAQEMKVGLDRMTLGYAKAEDQQSIVIAQTTKRGDASVNAAKVTEGLVAGKWDKIVAAAQKRSDVLEQGGTSLQAAQAESGLKLAQSQEAKAEAIAAKAYAQAQDKANKDNANAQKLLTTIQNAAKVNEAKQNALIAIEQARANTEFAGSGVHIEITGINPTDANAVASATSWAMRTKVPK
jgi:dsDNA-binding SOS-regulon protein